MKINANEIIDQAKSETGLSDLGEPLFLEGLNRLIDSINNEANLNEIGIQAQPIRIQGLLSNRLRFEEDLKKFPETFLSLLQTLACLRATLVFLLVELECQFHLSLLHC